MEYFSNFLQYNAILAKLFFDTNDRGVLEGIHLFKYLLNNLEYSNMYIKLSSYKLYFLDKDVSNLLNFYFGRNLINDFNDLCILSFSKLRNKLLINLEDKVTYFSLLKVHFDYTSFFNFFMNEQDKIFHFFLELMSLVPCGECPPTCCGAPQEIVKFYNQIFFIKNYDVFERKKIIFFLDLLQFFNYVNINDIFYLLNLLSKGIYIKNSLFLNDIILSLPLIFIFIFYFYLFIYFIYLNFYVKSKISVVFFLIYFFITIFFLFLNFFFSFNLSNFFLYNYIINIDNIIINVILFLIFIFIIYIYIFYDYFNNEKYMNFEFIFIVILAIFGLIILICSFDFLTLYISIELQTLCFYILSAYKYFSNFSTEAGLKYFILGSISSGFLLFGISILYGITGSMNFYDIYLFIKGLDTTINLSLNFLNLLTKNIQYSEFDFINLVFFYKFSIFFCFLFIFFSFFFKLGLAPFHVWLPDVYQGSPSISTFFFILLPKIGFFIIFIKILWYNISILYLKNYYIDLDYFNSFGSRSFLDIHRFKFNLEFIEKLYIKSNIEFFYYNLDKLNEVLNLYDIYLFSINLIHIFSIKENIINNLNILNFNYLFLICSFLSLFIGSLSTLNQIKLKRFIAFSAITHVGFIFINFLTFNLFSLNVSLLYIFIYTLINLNFFSVFLSIRDSFFNNKLKTIFDFSNIYKVNKVLIYFFILNLFTLAGIPPFSGFFIKMYIFINIINISFLFIFFLIIISCLSAFYYIRLIKISLFNLNKNNKSIKRISKISSYVIVLINIFNLFFFLFPNFFFEYFFHLILSINNLNLNIFYFFFF